MGSICLTAEITEFAESIRRNLCAPPAPGACAGVSVLRGKSTEEAHKINHYQSGSPFAPRQNRSPRFLEETGGVCSYREFMEPGWV